MPSPWTAAPPKPSTLPRRAGSPLLRLGRFAIDLVFPWRCVGCRAEGRRAICAACLARVRWIENPLCERCGLPFPSGPERSCARCLDRSPAFARARAVAWYRAADEAADPLAGAIRALKYGGQRGLGRELGRLLGERQPFVRGEQDVVVPVPLHASRLRERGFNQALLLGFETARRLQVRVERFALYRSRPTPPQTGLHEKERRANLAGAFTVVPSGRFEGQRVLLVDDVMTTGATAEACARELVESGASSVDVLALARTVLR